MREWKIEKKDVYRRERKRRYSIINLKNKKWGKSSKIKQVIEWQRKGITH